MNYARAVLITWLVTAAWDFVCASALAMFAYNTPFARFWQGVASTVLGGQALQMGARGWLAGLGLHLSVALVWSLIFVLALAASPLLRRLVATTRGALAAAVVY